MLMCACAAPSPPPGQDAPAARSLDDFEPVAAWTAHPSDGVSLAIREGAGYHGSALRLDVDFHGGGGYAIARKTFDIDLPENYEIGFRIRGDVSPNNLEFKLIDPSGENVWWVNRRNFEFPDEWETVTIKKRHVEFAWGPAGGGELERVAAIEIAITAGNGGDGTVWIDELELRELEPVRPYDLTPSLEASSALSGFGASRAHDGDRRSAWRSAGDGRQWVAIDFLRNRELGGLTIDWDSLDYAREYLVEASTDGESWETLVVVEGSDGGRDYLYLPETETRHLRLSSQTSSRGEGYGIAEIAVQPLEWSASRNRFLEAVARDAPRGSYPRYLYDEASYWTVVGVDGGKEEALINEEGMVETAQAGFSIEPFLYLDGRLITWNDAVTTPSLARGYLPIPTVRWEAPPLILTVSAFAADPPGGATLYLTYELENLEAAPLRPTLFLALRPFQVNPTSQFLNVPGGFAPVESLAYDGRIVRVNDGERYVAPLDRPAGFGAVTFDGGSVVESLRHGELPGASAVEDDFGAASGALAYPLDLSPGARGTVHIAVPLAEPGQRPETNLPPARARAFVSERLDETAAAWAGKLGRVEVALPPDAEQLEHTLRTTIAYILINRDGPAIQPGSRAYNRSWIRDGALTSAALLRFGQPQAVREFIEWYAGFQYPNGKVPCCVDRRGADPVPEHDSTGQFIYLVMEYFRFTGDRELLERMWPQVRRAVAYLDSLRHERMTAEYRTPEKRMFFGLLPESISHEGYSAKPVHSYWDDFFAVKGFADAAAMADTLGRPEAAELRAVRDEFRRDLLASLRAAMEAHGIDYLPGSADLGDFDPSATTVGLEPAGLLGSLPPEALTRTFERYYDNFVARRDGRMEWENYTPYEMRLIGAFVRLGWKERAHELLDFFLVHRRPAAWNHWAEVVWRDPRRPEFIGDMPHTWVGSDFLRSVADMFAYEDAENETLVIGAGLPSAWVLADSGVVVRGLRTHHGPLDLAFHGDGDVVRVRVGGGLTPPPGGLILRSPLPRPLRAVTIDGEPAGGFETGAVRVDRVPADVVLRY